MSLHDEKCDHCYSGIGESAKVQPFTVKRPDDGKVEGTYCPMCMVWWRATQSSGDGWHGHAQFNASQMCVARCQFCHWTMVSFGARPGEGLRCSHCNRPGAIKVPPEREHLKLLKELLEHAREETGKSLGVRGKERLPSRGTLRT